MVNAGHCGQGPEGRGRRRRGGEPQRLSGCTPDRRSPGNEGVGVNSRSEERERHPASETKQPPPVRKPSPMKRPRTSVHLVLPGPPRPTGLPQGSVVPLLPPPFRATGKACPSCLCANCPSTPVPADGPPTPAASQALGRVITPPFYAPVSAPLAREYINYSFPYMSIP